MDRNRQLVASPSQARGVDEQPLPRPQLCRYTASDGYALTYRHWRPETPRAYVIGLHGIQSHGGWYEYSSSRLCAAGFDVRFLDRRGSGAHQAERGHAVHPDRLINDVAQCLAAVRYERDQAVERREHAGVPIPVVLMSVSWGGRLAATLAGERGELVDGLALLYPGILTRIGLNPLQRFSLRTLLRLGVTRRSVRIPLDDPAVFTQDRRRQEYIRQDPLALHAVTTSFLGVSEQLRQRAVGHGDRIRCPTLLMLAGRDRIVDNRRTRDWYGRLGSTFQTLHEYAAAAHTLEFEAERELFIRDLIDWLSRVCRRHAEPLPVDSTCLASSRSLPTIPQRRM